LLIKNFRKMDKKELVNKFVDTGCLLSPELVYALENENSENILGFLEALKKKEEKPLVLTTRFFFEIRKDQPTPKDFTPKDANEPTLKESIPEKSSSLISEKIKLAKLRVEPEKPKIKELPKHSGLQEQPEIKKVNNVKILYSYNAESKKTSVNDFTNYFRTRYLKLRDMLSSHPKLENLISINKISNQKDEFSMIGMVQERRITKNGNVFVVLEDLTGTARIIVSKRNKELFDKAENLAQDEVIGIKGRASNQFVFANEIIQTDFYGKEKVCGGEGYALFTSDLHVGSNKFLEKEFTNFIRWLNLETNGKHKEIAKKCKYLFIAGDIVDGIGIYPT